MKAEIINVGEELLSGDTLNTNSQYISRKLYESGVRVNYHTTIGDNLKDVIDSTIKGVERSDLLIFTGGLGPTGDDLTKEGVCEALGLKLEVREEILDKIKDRFKNYGVKMTENNIKQAMLPKDGIELVNDFGTAPGLAINIKDKNIVLLPGPPNELNPMLDQYLNTVFKKESKDKILAKTIMTAGIGESTLETNIKDIIKEEKDLTIATYAGNGQVKLRISTVKESFKEAEKSIDNAIERIQERIGEFIYSLDGETLEEVVFKLLLREEKKIAFCESCTGGLLSSRLTRLSGVSSIFDRGIVTYSNEAKVEEVKVSSDTLKKYGAVSKYTALEMAKGLLKRENIDIGVSITGIAGPTGGSDEKPVGLVFIGLATENYSNVWKFNFAGDRRTVQNRTANMAFYKVIKFLTQEK
ncbi:competence/damage-inducible protein A [Sporosalibacterium faouarense]|uniref:competence/damage-inducible protein A n=1 Tax=Sporosalibacterium faouarense TaxID=516123 RepID=UPI00141CE721|nr:competence/damage-inducible protein A [Sporosalibacterium faouarense]MTI48058.1 competence/damage-inducible protein A [Bacillota bacterium]